jgi:hypothetical protein
VKSCQIDKETDTIDKRVFGRDTFSIIYGARFTGKSVLLSNLVEEFYSKGRTFQEILILTPSIKDKAWNNVKTHKKVTIFNKCTNELLYDLLQEQEERMLEGIKHRVLLIIDDHATQGKALKALEEIAVRGRHNLITCIITAQYSRLLSPVIRQNAQHVVLFKMGDDELKNLAHEGLRSLVSVEEFVDWVKQHTQKVREFVHINLRDPKRIFNIGFSD